MSIFAAVVLGLVQALTEFLPVSSTAHLLVFGELFGQSLADGRFRAFVAIIQAGTTIAVIVFFWRDLVRLVRAGFGSLVRLRPFESEDSRLAWLIALGTIPAVAAGLLLENWIEGLGNVVIAASLVVWGLVLLAAERFARHLRKMSEVTPRDAVAIGLAQALALIPGTSRSGATLSAGIALGLKREDAARFSFLLSVPVILGAGTYKLKKVLPDLDGQPDWALATIIGTAVSFVAGYLVIGWLLAYLRTRTTYLFVAWRLVAGVLIALLLWGGFLPLEDWQVAARLSDVDVTVTRSQAPPGVTVRTGWVVVDR